MSVSYGGYPPMRRVNFGWISEAFDLFKANAGVWVIATLLAFVPSLIGGIIGFIDGIATAGQSGASTLPPPGSNPFSSRALYGGLPPLLSFIIQIFSTLYGAWLSGGVYRTAVKQVRGEMISIGDLFSGGAILWRMLGFGIVYGLATAIGTLLCILPGILVAGLLFPGYALVADGETVGDAVTRSWDGMKQDLWNAAAFVFVLGLVLFAGILACGVGLFVTLPMFYLAAALAYRDMIGMPGSGQTAPAYGTAAPGVWPPPPNAAPPPWGSTPGTPQAYPPPEAGSENPPEEPPINPWQPRPPQGE